MIVDYGPDSPGELELKAILAGLHREYLQRCEPFVKRLTDLHATKLPTRMMYVPDLGVPTAEFIQAEKFG